jgi:tetratricopeptide (TPR) repeat protein
MYARLTVLLLIATALTGCGTRSIVVPVTRPALMDVHRCERVLILPCDVSKLRKEHSVRDDLGSDARWFASGSLAATIDQALPAALAATGQTEYISDTNISVAGLLSTPGKVSGELLHALRERYDASCILAVRVLHAHYNESILTAPIQSAYASNNSEKRVRMARGSLVLGMLLIDAVEGRVAFADSIRSDISRETHSTDRDPPYIDLEDTQWLLVNQAVLRIAEATQPLRDREIVTFLVDDDFPEIPVAIEYAELGRWKEAEALLDSTATRIGERRGSDKLWYNLGLMRQYAGNFFAAKAAFETARRIADSGRYRAAIERLLRAEEEYLERTRQEL